MSTLAASLTHFDKLSKEQRDVFEFFQEHRIISKQPLQLDDPQIATLKGCAGSGKTFLARAIIEYCRANDIPVRVTATTNQAVYVLRGQLDLPDEHVATIHSLLGLRMVPDNRTGGLKLKNDQSQIPRVPRNGVVLVDEASQTPSILYQEIQRTTTEHQHCSFLFIGDPAQLGPVDDEENISPAMTEPSSATLETIHRQAEGNPIIQAATAVRNGKRWRHLAQYNEERQQGIALTQSVDGIKGSAYRAFSSETYENNPLHARILCAKNKTVHLWNDRMRRAIYGKDAEEFQEGMWVIAQDAWVPDKIVLLTTSELMKITDCNKFEASFMGWEGNVWDIDAVSYYRGPVSAQVVAQESRASYDKKVEELLATAKKEGKGHWGTYYDFAQRYADIRPAYASTIHKAQGTTLDRAYYIDRDVQYWPKSSAAEKPKLRYVALTRAANQLAVLV